MRLEDNCMQQECVAIFFTCLDIKLCINFTVCRCVYESKIRTQSLKSNVETEDMLTLRQISDDRAPQEQAGCKHR